MSGLTARIARRRAARSDPPDEQPTLAAPTAEPGQPAKLSSRQRIGLRRRARYLRGLRALQLRDLGGLVFDLHRFGRRREDLVAVKLSQLDQTDREMRAAEAALGATRTIDEVHEAGIGGSCPSCGALFAGDARYCSACGAGLEGEGAAPAPSVAEAGG